MRTISGMNDLFVHCNSLRNCKYSRYLGDCYSTSVQNVIKRAYFENCSRHGYAVEDNILKAKIDTISVNKNTFDANKSSLK